MNIGVIEKESGYETARAIREIAERLAAIEERINKLIADVR